MAERSDVLPAPEGPMIPVTPAPASKARSSAKAPSA